MWSAGHVRANLRQAGRQCFLIQWRVLIEPASHQPVRVAECGWSGAWSALTPWLRILESTLVYAVRQREFRYVERILGHQFQKQTGFDHVLYVYLYPLK